ncbi:CAP-Gly domain-containing linker protein 1-like isoform X2 [Littorina saxatilis]|uniref:CAP-Gly domain-containing linker protein 1-like isoform X2 n=1 Tax=Littorina saxatilis TaxID=31220 RepID=UPI0038B4D31C
MSLSQLRPVLECRMPTLASKAAFILHGDERSAMPGAAGHRPGGLRQLQQSVPPRTMRDVRAAVTKEMKSVTRKVARLEREYYGDKKTVHNEVEKYAYSVKVLMKSLWILDLNKASAIDEMIKQAANPDRYKQDPKHPAALKEVWAKIQTFLPDRVSVLVESCQGMFNNLVRYCVSFYDAEKDGYLETPAHYTEQIAVWKEKAELSIQSARNLYKKFRTSGITASMLSSPVKAFCSRSDIHKLLFLVMFADACTHIRSALSVMTQWLSTDENYAAYVKNDLTELEKLKEEKMKVLREMKQKCHTLTYTQSKLEQDHAKLTHELHAMKEKEQSLRIDEVSLVNALNDMELEMEFKERRRENIKKRPAVSEHGEASVETYETLTSELKSLKERLPMVLRSLAQVRLKLGQVDNKLGQLEKAERDLIATKRELKQAEEDRDLKEQEFVETEEAAQLARKILLCKTANDATEKLYYSVPFGTKTVKTKGETAKGPMARICKLISTKIERDWVQLYLNLPFYPQRGEETIEHDVMELTELGSRASVSWTARQALERWKRYHTRANVEDLRRTLRKIKRSDIIKVIDEGFKSPAKVVDPFELQEEAPPPVRPELVPFYRLIERYDQIRASKAKS